MCISTGHFNSIFLLGAMPLFELRNLAKMKDTTVFFCQRNCSETAQQNFVKLCSNEGHNVQMCIYTGNFDLIFFLGAMPLFELRNLTKMKDTTETVGQHNSTETAQQNCVKLCSYEGHNVQICIFTGNADLILLRSNLYPLFCPIACP